MEIKVDCCFALSGSAIPLDHGYAVFGAVSRILPEFHERTAWALHPIAGSRVAPGLLALTSKSALTVRAPASDLGKLLPLAGKTLELDGHRVVVGTPNVVMLRAATTIRSRFVTIKGGKDDAKSFHALGTRAISRLSEACADLKDAQLHVGERRVMRVGTHTVVGFAVDIETSPEASLFLQALGLGGRRHMGAGVFIPKVK